MKCDRARKLLPLEIGGDLPSDEGRAVMEHVECCPDCRALSEELSRSLAWLRSAGAAPASESDYAELRRGVWRRIESEAPASRSLRGDWRRPALAFAGCLAAIFAAFLLVRREPSQAPIAASRAVASPSIFAAATPAAASEASERGGQESAPSVSPEEAAPATRVSSASLPPRVRRHRPSAEGAAGIERIEFRTANPNVRIIWLLRKAGDKSSSLSPGRNQEVS